MSVFAFWNNKGGTGKTSLSFQTICAYAEKHKGMKILAIDLCPQANLSELFLGGLIGKGGIHLTSLYESDKRRSIGGYFQERMPSPFSMPSFNYKDFLCHPHRYNRAVSANIDLVAGDSIVELQTNAIATLSNTRLPGPDTWLAVIDWLNDFIKMTENQYDDIFIDTNPSFSVYTQIALAAANRLVLPVMADDSSRRAIQNAFSLVHGIKLPSAMYKEYSFAEKLRNAGRALPLVHLVVKNRLTQYMGSATAYNSVLNSIDNDLNELLASHPDIFTFSSLSEGLVEIRDFQTTGVVAFAEGKPFIRMNAGTHNIQGRDTQIRQDYIENCRSAIATLVNKL
ncbi:ATPase domain protein [Desulfosporosinus sp. I2]|uniref:ParA family protein n=1 Tax=Desulfosporosinus sp. I2 TaxID=1617025 RepID=UPI0005F06658|nr:ParA family protein [Desulfosporosinus sp. I2]KJR46474.1 ATPase domain protein [Desulfosporosinus sp. I2]